MLLDGVWTFKKPNFHVEASGLLRDRKNYSVKLVEDLTIVIESLIVFLFICYLMLHLP